MLCAKIDKVWFHNIHEIISGKIDCHSLVIIDSESGIIVELFSNTIYRVNVIWGCTLHNITCFLFSSCGRHFLKFDCVDPKLFLPSNFKFECNF